MDNQEVVFKMTEYNSLCNSLTMGRMLGAWARNKVDDNQFRAKLRCERPGYVHGRFDEIRARAKRMSARSSGSRRLPAPK